MTITELLAAIDPLQTIAVILGISGAALVAGKKAASRLSGFSCWIIANLIWFFEGVYSSNYYLAAMFGFYWITAIVGFWNSLKLKEKIERKSHSASVPLPFKSQDQ
ncbi:hypothetical protein [Methanolacinia paynteri]|uniref:hypothetical protein n=1 Tax=Methanolacinia paynteri TaxID=230356 RepID=UPI00064F239F|nr:hypothetical protein [Methanolacinia paynteri]